LPPPREILFDVGGAVSKQRQFLVNKDYDTTFYGWTQVPPWNKVPVVLQVHKESRDFGLITWFKNDRAPPFWLNPDVDVIKMCCYTLENPFFRFGRIEHYEKSIVDLVTPEHPNIHGFAWRGIQHLHLAVQVISGETMNFEFYKRFLIAAKAMNGLKSLLISVSTFHHIMAPPAPSLGYDYLVMMERHQRDLRLINDDAVKLSFTDEIMDVILMKGKQGTWRVGEADRLDGLAVGEVQDGDIDKVTTEAEAGAENR
jgi:hypothetical protein